MVAPRMRGESPDAGALHRPKRIGKSVARRPDNILIIDDEELIRDTLAEYLSQEGFSVTVCASGEVALERASGQPFAIALCDVHKITAKNVAEQP